MIKIMIIADDYRQSGSEDAIEKKKNVSSCKNINRGKKFLE